MQKEDQEKIMKFHRIGFVLGTFALLVLAGSIVWAWLIGAWQPLLLLIVTVCLFVAQSLVYRKIEDLRARKNFYTGRK